jgi:DNA-binding transcriptional regulator YhcF (GntR family)
VHTGGIPMQNEPFRIVSPERYDIATEVLSSAVRVLQAAGFSEEEIPKLFQQVADRPVRVPVWIEPL